MSIDIIANIDGAQSSLTSANYANVFTRLYEVFSDLDESIAVVIDSSISSPTVSSGDWFVVYLPKSDLQVWFGARVASVAWHTDNILAANNYGVNCAFSADGGWVVGSDNPNISKGMFTESNHRLLGNPADWHKIRYFAYDFVNTQDFYVNLIIGPDGLLCFGDGTKNGALNFAGAILRYYPFDITDPVNECPWVRLNNSSYSGDHPLASMFNRIAAVDKTRTNGVDGSSYQVIMDGIYEPLNEAAQPRNGKYTLLPIMLFQHAVPKQHLGWLAPSMVRYCARNLAPKQLLTPAGDLMVLVSLNTTLLGGICVPWDGTHI